MTVTPNLTGLRYIRQGKCNRCGWCCEQEDCEHLERGEMATCKIYDERFERCWRYPEMPPIMHEGCGYYFLDTWEDNKVVKRHL